MLQRTAVSAFARVAVRGGTVKLLLLLPDMVHRTLSVAHTVEVPR